MKNCNKKSRIGGFSLPELLIVIAIIGVMATLVLAVARNAQEDTRTAATKSRIIRIETILNQELDRYEVRRLPITNTALRNVAGSNVLAFRNLRQQILQDLINVEFPRSNNDLGVFPTVTTGFRTYLESFGYGTPAMPEFQPSSTVLSWEGMGGRDNSGEFLFEILQRVNYDGGSALGILGNSAIGDFDSNDYLEIQDAWGFPLQFQILQAASDETDWSRINPVTGLPQGYVALDPMEPCELSKIRFWVYSVNIQN